MAKRRSETPAASQPPVMDTGPLLQRPSSALIVRLSAIGDVIHTIPCLLALKRRHPDLRVGWLVEELSASLLQGHPDIDDLFVIPKKQWRRRPLKTWTDGSKPAFYRRLRQPRWDVAVDFQGLTKSGWPAWLSGACRRVGYGDHDGRELNKLFTNLKITPPADLPHVIQRNMSLLQPFGIDPHSEPIEWRFPDFTEERRRLSPFLESLESSANRGFIGLYPGAGWETKRWPPEHFARLARLIAESGRTELGRPAVLIWGPGEKPLVREIVEAANLPPERLVAAPPTTLRELAALLESAAIIVGGDTGPIHLAAALGRPVVCLFGAADPVRNGPWGRQHVILESRSVPCIRCWKKRCDRPEPVECLRSIEPERVLEAIAEVLERTSPPRAEIAQNP